MKIVACLGIIALLAGQSLAQGVAYQPGGSVDTTGLQSQIDNAMNAAQAAQNTATQASQDAAAANSAASAAATPAQVSSAIAAAPFVKTVNGTAPSASGDVANLATTSAVSTAVSTAVSGEATARDSAIASAVAPTLRYIAGFTTSSPGLRANLPTCGGASAPVGSYAIISDLYSSSFNTNEAMRCGNSGTLFYWKSVRTDASVSMATPTTALSLIPLVTPPVIHFTSSAAANSTITPSSVGAWPGEQFVLVQDGLLGLFSLQIGGLLGGVLNMVTGGTRTLTYSCTAAATPVCGWVGS